MIIGSDIWKRQVETAAFEERNNEGKKYRKTMTTGNSSDGSPTTLHTQLQCFLLSHANIKTSENSVDAQNDAEDDDQSDMRLDFWAVHRDAVLASDMSLIDNAKLCAELLKSGN